MKRNVNVIVASILLVSGIISYGAAAPSDIAALEPTVIIQFKDKPGSYLIKIETVKNVNIKRNKYTTISQTVEEFNQVSDNSYSKYIKLPNDATAIRISIRIITDGKVGGGKYTFIDANDPRKIAMLYGIKGRDGKITRLNKKVDPGIRIVNPFEKEDNDVNLDYDITVESSLVPF